MDNFDNAVKPYMSVFDNEYVHAILIIILITYASLAAPRLPHSVVRLFEHPIVKFIFFFLIVYVTKHSVVVSLISALVVLVLLMALNNWDTTEMMDNIDNNMNNLELNLNTCNGWDCQKLVVHNAAGKPTETINEIVPYDDTDTEGYPVDDNAPVNVPVIMPAEQVAHKVEPVKQPTNLYHSTLKFLHIEGFENNDSSSYASV
jgi:hypothetical protein